MMLDMLHDEIDKLEDFRDRAKEIVENVVHANLRQALDETHDIAAAMVLLAQMVEAELTELTTEAFKAGIGFARSRAEA